MVRFTCGDKRLFIDTPTVRRQILTNKMFRGQTFFHILYPILFILQYSSQAQLYSIITILHRGGGLESLLQYYSFERKMEGYIPFSALN